MERELYLALLLASRAFCGRPVCEDVLVENMWKYERRVGPECGGDKICITFFWRAMVNPLKSQCSLMVNRGQARAYVTLSWVLGTLTKGIKRSCSHGSSPFVMDEMFFNPATCMQAGVWISASVEFLAQSLISWALCRHGVAFPREHINILKIYLRTENMQHWASICSLTMKHCVLQRRSITLC